MTDQTPTASEMRSALTEISETACFQCYSPPSEKTRATMNAAADAEQTPTAEKARHAELLREIAKERRLDADGSAAEALEEIADALDQSTTDEADLNPSHAKVTVARQTLGLPNTPQAYKQVADALIAAARVS